MSRNRPKPTASFLSLILQLVLFAVVALVAFWPTTRLWGVHHLGYYPAGVRVTLLGLAALSFVPAIARVIYSLLLRIAGLLTAASRRATLVRVGTATAAFVLLIAFSAKTALLGDGDLQTKIWGGAAHHGTSFDDFMKITLGNIQQTFALGTNVAAYWVAKAGMVLGYDYPVSAILIFFALLGAVLLFVVIDFFRRSELDPAFAVVAMTAVLLTGAIQLFCGYVEVYVPIIVVAAVYLMTAATCLRTRRHLWVPPVMLALAAFMHVQALLLAPSLVVLIAGGVLRQRGARVVRALGIGVIAASVVGAFVLKFLPATSRFFLPMLGTTDAYGVLSADHALDMANALLLNFPVGVALAGAALARGGGTNAEPSTDEMWLRAFHVSLATAGLLFLVLFHPDLGMANDWDLYVLPVLCIAVPVLRAVGKKTAGLDRATAARLIVPAMALGVLIVVPWVGINASERRAVQRYEDVIANDRMSSAYGLEILASYYKGKGDIFAEIRTLESAISVSANPRYRFTLGLRYYHIGEHERAIETLSRCLVTKPDYHDARKFLMRMLFDMKRYDDLIPVAEGGARLQPREPDYPFYLGKAYAEAGRVPEALAALDRCRSLKMPARMRDEVDALTRALESTR